MSERDIDAPVGNNEVMEEQEKPNRLGEIIIAFAIFVIAMVIIDVFVTIKAGCSTADRKDKVLIMGRDEGTIHEDCGNGKYRIRKQNGGVIVTLDESEFVRVKNGKQTR